MKKNLKHAILNGFYDSDYPGHALYGPKLLENDSQENIWSALRQELLTCQSFTWAVAFITQDMLIPLKAVLSDLAKQKITGTIITGDYLNFNNPRVFFELEKIPNLKIKIAQKDGFHAKGYLFKHEDYETVIIGSANFTRSALLSNYEWSLKVSSAENSALTKEISRQINKLVEDSSPLTQQWLENYKSTWIKPVSVPNDNNISREIEPNKMQKEALESLSALVKNNEHRGLVVSATGTGKTYLGAFAVKRYKPKKFLYVVHRLEIANKSLKSFQKVLGGDKKDFGILSGNKKEIDCKYVFATIQTISQENMLQQFDPDEFDYILIDEAHRAASPSYQKILNYFRPDFWLGMTATPDRMDKQDVYRIFDYNLAYEIRLRDALEEKMLTPFHYVGVEDYEVNGQIVNETTNLRYLTADRRIKYVLKEMEYYGYCGKRACGLVFCSRQEEAKIIADSFTRLGHPAIALTNQDNATVRQRTISLLQSGKIEYIVTVDLFNEGVDIPELNQIVMLRNTQSSIVFIQQLGRGLRKYPNKEYVTVIDLIGNYKNNYLIPIALNNDKTRNKDILRSEIKQPGIVGLSTINFSRIASQRILSSLDNVKLDGLRELRDSYKELKQKIGRVPLLTDFDRYGAISPLLFIENKGLKHYGQFLNKVGENVELTEIESEILSFVTKELATGKRPHELVLLDELLAKQNISQADYISLLAKNSIYTNNQVLQSVENILTLSFFDIKTGKTTKKMQYGNQALITKDQGSYRLSAVLQESLNDNCFKNLLVDAIKTGLSLSKKYNSEEQFTLYKQYDRKDVCRLLNWPKDVSAPMYGYRVGEQETPIFITYEKNSAEKRNAIYDNSLEDRQSLRWYTRSPRHLDSAEIQKLLNTKNMKLYVFVKRNDAVGKKFFYLGQAAIKRDTVKEEKIGPKKKSTVGMDLELLTPLNTSMYEMLFD